MKSLHAFFGAGLWLVAGNLLSRATAGAELRPAAPRAAVRGIILPSIHSLGTAALSTGEDVLAEPRVGLRARATLFRVDRTRYHACRLRARRRHDKRLDYETDPRERAEFALENPEGFGVRAQLWSLEKEFEPDDGSLEARIATFYLDGYRRFVGENGELLLGGGLAYGSLKLDSPFADTVHRFNGLGRASAAKVSIPFCVSRRQTLASPAALAWPCWARCKTTSATARPCWWTSSAWVSNYAAAGASTKTRCGSSAWAASTNTGPTWTVPLAFDQPVEGTSLTVGFAW